MDTRKFEKLITLVINEDNAAASALFHDIVVEKSREIFESIMDEDDMEEGMGGKVGGLLDEINAEEADEGMYEEEEIEIGDDDDMGDDDMGDDMGDDEMDFDDEMDGDDFESGDDEEEETLIRIEDKLDQLMAEFEEIMGGDDDMDGEEDFGAEDDMEDDMGDEDEEAMMEAIQLKKISVTHGDNGAQTRSPVTFNSGSKGMDSNPVKFVGTDETVPTSPKKPSNPYTKGEGSLKGAGTFKNSPGKDNFSDKGEAAPKPVKGDNGSNFKSPVAESRRTTRRPIR
jgi:hypothetical protein